MIDYDRKPNFLAYKPCLKLEWQNFKTIGTEPFRTQNFVLLQLVHVVIILDISSRLPITVQHKEIQMFKCFKYQLLITVKNTCTGVFVMLVKVFENCFKSLIKLSFHWSRCRLFYDVEHTGTEFLHTTLEKNDAFSE